MTFYQNDNCIIHQGDSRDILPELSKIDLIVTSPPYDNLRTYQGNNSGWGESVWQEIISACYESLTLGGVMVWVVGDATVKGSETGSSFKQALYAMKCGFNLHDTMIYKKTGGGARGSNLCYWQRFEYMFVLSKGRPKSINLLHDRKNTKAGCKDSGVNGRNRKGEKVYKKVGTVADVSKRGNVWTIPAGNNTADDKTAHPAVFPESLAKDHILSWSNPGDLVCDPFCGAGTTAKMAKLTGRKFVGIELEEEYCRIAVDRISQEVLAL